MDRDTAFALLEQPTDSATMGKATETRADRLLPLAVNHHANELNAMRAMSYDLERKHHEDKRG
jgi:hypothetical protein